MLLKSYSFRLLLLLLCFPTLCSAASLKGKTFEWNYPDTVFRNPYIDADRIENNGKVKYRYIHGGFDDGTRFSFYFPVSKKGYKPHFIQYASPFPDSETSSQAGFNGEDKSMIDFAIDHGFYYVETNSGGQTDFSDPGKARPADIGAYRANAASADFSRLVAGELYGGERPYGYIFGGSGGAYRTAGSIENTSGVWDGAVPFVLGSPMAIPNVFGVRMNAMRVLRDKMPQILDALEPGGSRKPGEGLTQEEYQTFREATQMGFPLQSWYALNNMGVHGFRVLYKSMVQIDPSYFNNDFWNVEGYLGANPTESLIRDRVKTVTTVKRPVGYDEAVGFGVAELISEADRGSADKAWAFMGTGTEKPAAFELDYVIPDVGFNGGDMVVLSGKAAGQTVQVSEANGSVVGIAPTNSNELLSSIQPGDSVLIDNSNFLATQTYYRHQVPSRDYYVWDQFLDVNGQPLYPQRPVNLGPLFAAGAAGTVPTGNIKGKVILLESLYDTEAFPWQADWYRNRVRDYLGDTTDDNFRLWYIDHCTHGGIPDPARNISYYEMLCQALLDLSDWCEHDIKPAETTNYTIADIGQVRLPATAEERKGIQPVAIATVGNGEKRIEVNVGEPVTVHVLAQMPQGYGKVTEAQWSDGTVTNTWGLKNGDIYTTASDLSKAKYSTDGSEVEFEQTFTYDRPGTYFPSVKVSSQRQADKNDRYTAIQNIDRVRIVVK